METIRRQGGPYRLPGLARAADSLSLTLVRLFQARSLFQPYGTTQEDRYPLIFRYAAEALTGVPAPRLLSFGCSTGEEVFTLRRYFPTARITGLDIVPARIRRARARLARDGGDPRLRFAVAASAEHEAAQSYDAVFAMAVFRHGGLGAGPARCDGRIAFEDFERSVGALAGTLKPGGLLAIRHANFRFSDTAAAAGFTQVLKSPPAPARSPPLYGRDHRRLPDAERDDGIFRKALPPAIRPDGSGNGAVQSNVA